MTGRHNVCQAPPVELAHWLAHLALATLVVSVWSAGRRATPPIHPVIDRDELADWARRHGVAQVDLTAGTISSVRFEERIQIPNVWGDAADEPAKPTRHPVDPVEAALQRMAQRSGGAS